MEFQYRWELGKTNCEKIVFRSDNQSISSVTAGAEKLREVRTPRNILVALFGLWGVGRGGGGWFCSYVLSYLVFDLLVRHIPFFPVSVVVVDAGALISSLVNKPTGQKGIRARPVRWKRPRKGRGGSEVDSGLWTMWYGSSGPFDHLTI